MLDQFGGAGPKITSNHPDKVDILLLGSGGREHALLVKLAESPRAGRLFVAPGNGGMLTLAESAPVDQDDPAGVAEWAKANGIGLVVIGPEAPLVAGVADAVRAAGIPCFGPNAAGAQMEGSKEFAKQVMGRAGVPTAATGPGLEVAPPVEVFLLRAQDGHGNRLVVEELLHGAADRGRVFAHGHGIHEHRRAPHLLQGQQRRRGRAPSLTERIPAEKRHDGILHRP